MWKSVKFEQELRKEGVELRRSLQQSKVESQFLREELRKTGGQSATPAHFMEEKIQLLKEACVIHHFSCIISRIILLIYIYKHCRLNAIFLI